VVAVPAGPGLGLVADVVGVGCLHCAIQPGGQGLLQPKPANLTGTDLSTGAAAVTAPARERRQAARSLCFGEVLTCAEAGSWGAPVADRRVGGSTRSSPRWEELVVRVLMLAARPQLEAMLAFVRDTRGTASLDPLARSIDDLRTLVPVSRPHSPARADRTSHRQVP